MSMIARVVSALITTSSLTFDPQAPANMEFLRWQQPLTRETANPNAATAAASAFMRRESSNSLSSAAAAAALRARPTTPTNVAQVQSKRAMRRSASVSSTGSRDKGGRDLHRTPSTSSMTDRTFRSPSPARSAAPNSHDVPPVPSIPHGGQYKTDKTSSSHKRATSLQIQPFRTASQKMNDGQGSWFGAAAAGDPSNVRRSDAAMEPRISSDLRPSSPSSSINFSYPRSSLDPGSEHALVYDPNSRRMVPRADLLIREQSIRDASEKPVKKKKSGVSRGGSHLNRGTVSRIKGTAVEAPVPSSTAVQTTRVPANTADIVPQKQNQEPKQIPKPALAIKTQPVVEQPQPEQEPLPQPQPVEEPHSEPESESELGLESDVEEPANYDQGTTHQTPVFPPDNLPRSSPVKKRPSIVHELPELEDQYDQEHRAAFQSQEPLVSEELQRKSSPPIQTEPDATVIETESPEPEIKEAELQPPKSQAIFATPNQTPSRTRVHSESPARTPHFAPTTDQLIVRHEPPSRSLSPRKSAMKHRSPTRDASPSEDGSEASSAFMGVGTHTDPGLARRKSVRVSFDDQNTMVVGESAEPREPDLTQLPSPQVKKAWHNIISRPKRDSVSLDEDEKMTPRPALPSFGSIREKKTRDSEERPLVRPSERPWSPPVVAVASNQSDSNQVPAADPGQSSDLAIGSILAQEQSSRNAANISKYREPLPPVVTSVDSHGYISNSSDDDMDVEAPVEMDQEQPANSSPSMHPAIGSAELGSNESIPMISISHPSPRVEGENQPDSPQDFFDLPGGFPDDDSTPKSDEARTPTLDALDKPPRIVDNSISAQTVVSKQPPPLTPQRSMESNIGVPPSPQIHDIQEEDEDTDGSSIYSDAYEDLSDMDGDGFMSLDAIVDSPVNKVSQKLFEKTVAKSKEHEVAKDAMSTETVAREPLQTQDDWERAKAYWKSLSTDKRRQLEKEAGEEAGEEADLDEVAPQPKKTKKRRSLEKGAEQVLSAPPPDPSRVYQIQPGTTWQAEVPESPPKAGKAKSSGGSKLRKSMRGEEPKALEQSRPIQSGSMRKSMRSGDASAPSSHEVHMRKSLRAEPEAVVLTGNRIQKSLRSNGSTDGRDKSRPSVNEKVRPASYQPTAAEQVQPHRRNQSADRVTPSAAMTASASTKPTLRRRGSDSSESSFRRARTGGGEGFGFKRTMRGNPRESAGPQSDRGRGSSRFSLRSLSPTGSAFRRNSGTISPPVAMGGRMRQSLRGDSSDRSTSSLRMSGFGRPSNKTKKTKKGRNNSRFADSSDEEDARPAFRSRFAESSDEDDAPSPTPKGNKAPRTMRNKTSSSAAAAAMGVPQSQREEEDSPDLPDSDDEIQRPQSVPPASGMVSRPAAMLNRSGSGRDNMRSPTQTQPANAQASGTSRPGHTRRGSLMSILRRKKDGSGKISRPVSESAARRDTRLERSTEELAVVRNTSTSHNSRLQKRERSWPLQDSGDGQQQDDGYGEDESHDTYVNDDKRPSTASGHVPSSPTAAMKHGFLKRRSTLQGAIGLAHHDDSEVHGTRPEDLEVSQVPPEQRKKKFGSLRKMFGLHD